MLKLYTTNEAAEVLRRHPKTLREWRVNGGGPRFFKPKGSGHALYSAESLEEFLGDEYETTAALFAQRDRMKAYARGARTSIDQKDLRAELRRLVRANKALNAEVNRLRSLLALDRD